MRSNNNDRGSRPVLRAVIEIGFIVFLFYANLLMGEYTASRGEGKALSAALSDIVTGKNLAIALVSAFIGYIAFEYLRKKC
jgi:hypothetical protein